MSSAIRGEERLVPFIRSELARRFARGGIRASEIARTLNVSQPAVAQYLKGKRGRGPPDLNFPESLVSPLAERILKRFRSGQGGIEGVELLEAARQVLVLKKGVDVDQVVIPADKNRAALKLLQERLVLELKAAEKYLELSNRTGDEHTKLLLRLIASDSMRHADIVSQVVSWLEIGGTKNRFEPPDHALLEDMVSLEDSAAEVNLGRSIRPGHPVARLLLEWIDADEEKHERIVKRILRLTGDRPEPPKKTR